MKIGNRNPSMPTITETPRDIPVVKPTELPQPLLVWQNTTQLYKELLQLLNECSAFTGLEKRNVQEFIQCFPRDEQAFQEDPQTISNWLCFLYCDAINPALDRVSSSFDQKELNEISSRVFLLLERVIPTDRNVNDEIVDYALHNEMVSGIEEQVDRIDELFQSLIVQATDKANVSNQELLKYFTKMQEQVQILKNSQQEKTVNVIGRLDTLTKKMEQAVSNCQVVSSNAVKIGDRLKKEQSDFQEIVKNSKKVFKKV